MTELIHGGDIYTAIEQGTTEENLLDFSANINPLGMPDAVKEAIKKALDQCSRYPDPLCRRLGSAVAEKEDLPRDNLVFGNGAADLIFRLTAAEAPKNGLVLAPSFTEYEKALTASGCRVIRHQLSEENGFMLTEDIFHLLSEDLDIVFLCNPNNPTGRLIPEDLLRKIIFHCRKKNIRTVVDECFIDFIREPVTVKNLSECCENLFILKAFTKNYAMAGLRLGYGICSDRRFLDKIRQAGQPWNVSLIAQEAGIAALTQDDYLKKARALIFREREVLYHGLLELGYQVFPPAANYIFFKPGRQEPEYIRSFKEDLQAEGILIRSCDNYEGLARGYFRTAVRTKEENQRLLQVLRRREQLWQNRL